MSAEEIAREAARAKFAKDEADGYLNRRGWNLPDCVSVTETELAEVILAALAAKDAEPKRTVTVRLGRNEHEDVIQLPPETPLTREPTSQEAGDTWMRKWGLSDSSVEAKPSWAEIGELTEEIKELRAREQQALKDSFMEGYNVGYSEGGNDAATFECGGGSRSREYLDRTREDAWQISQTLAALALPAAQQQPAPAAEQMRELLRDIIEGCTFAGDPNMRLSEIRKWCEDFIRTIPAAPSPAQEKPPIKIHACDLCGNFHDPAYSDCATGEPYLPAQEKPVEALRQIETECMERSPTSPDAALDRILSIARTALATASAPPAAAQE